MITVLVRVKQGPEALAATLEALVPAVAAGLVGDAVILADREDATVAKVADAVGATLVLAEDGSWENGVQAARRDWLLCLDDGDIPQEGWIRVLDRFISLNPPECGLARLRRSRGMLGWLGETLSSLFRLSSVRAGDLVHRRVLTRETKGRAPVRLPATVGRDPVLG